MFKLNPRLLTKFIWLACILVDLTFSTEPAQAASYNGVVLYQLNVPDFSFPIVAAGGQVSGFGNSTSTGGTQSGLLWTGGSNDPVNFTPAGYSYSVLDTTDGIQQGGYANGQAMLWNGSPNSFVNLQPSGFDGSSIYGVAGGQQVGFGYIGKLATTHALLWSGSAASVVDLNPVGYGQSVADATDGINQVGYSVVNPGGGTTFATLWSGSASSAVNLGPPGYLSSFAWNVRGSEQTGDGLVSFGLGSVTHALLWHGSASSVVDLNGGFYDSDGYDTNGSLVVGYGAVSASSPREALLWSGSASSVIDLQSLLPSYLITSTGWSFDASGNIFGTAQDSSNNWYAVEWTPNVPEPSAFCIALLGGGLMFRKRKPG